MVHECLNHLGVENVKLLFEKDLVEGLNIDYKDEFTFYDLAMCKGSSIGKHFQSKQIIRINSYEWLGTNQNTIFLWSEMLCVLHK